MIPLLNPVVARLRASGIQTSVIVSAPFWANFASDFIIYQAKAIKMQSEAEAEAAAAESDDEEEYEEDEV
ncbi:hypothetical protein E8E11_002573 [Didymella keratinophila]|nr:hypothetical protein E8E11_002573 [Didymella keratinophila]